MVKELQKIKKQIIVNFDVEGFHKYPNAPLQVEFLSNKHRHTFKIKVAFEVQHLNIDKEFFIIREQIKEYLMETYGSPCDFGNMSCEMIAQEIIEFASEDGVIWCEVWEEETAGARIEI